MTVCTSVIPHRRRKDVAFGRSGAGADAGAAVPVPAPVLQAAAGRGGAAALPTRHKTGGKKR